MSAPFKVQFSKGAFKYMEFLDAPTRKRIREKIADVAGDPQNPRHSYPLTTTDKRSARVGKYRIVLVLTEDTVVIADIDSRGQVYRDL